MRNIVTNGLGIIRVTQIFRKNFVSIYKEIFKLNHYCSNKANCHFRKFSCICTSQPKNNVIEFTKKFQYTKYHPKQFPRLVC